ncbi:MAG: 50S ribosomal protein L25 [Candidatus Nealsonbacteria bacterium]|nr:50S ribosomal protein L25 [Candidatus Nealsonbacteria bacterium]
MAQELKVEIRESRGKRNAKRLRQGGTIPAILYGHGLESVALSVQADVLSGLVQQGSRLVSLTGAVNESAMIRELQWNTWGTHLLHADFTRVSADEAVEVNLTLELRGEAPGLKEGGLVSHLLHELRIECPASAIPDRLQVNVNHLNLHDSITVGDLELPDGAKALIEDTAVVVQCVEPAVEEEEDLDGEQVEPEIIGEKKEEGKSDES